MANMPGPPCCKLACRMSGVFTKRFGRAWSACAAISRPKSAISDFPVRQVK
ncbi:Uncharacterised protein [Mycobacteroides abscessus subsp. abscessus]|nr:Uncharacterised protein [Mycobacteroides abscessus subsp. abscessus]